MKAYDETRIPRLGSRDTVDVQSLLLRPPDGPVVRHALLRVPDGKGLAARQVLDETCRISFDIPRAAYNLICSIGFTFDGLDALCLPLAYLRVFQRFSPSFREGAVRRSVAVGDTGPSSAAGWRPEFGQERAHVIVSWHGPRDAVDAAWQRLAWRWCGLLPRDAPAQATPDRFFATLEGERLGAPKGRVGQWAHFGFRDDVSDVAIDGLPRSQPAPDLRSHAPGSLLLGWMDDEGLNRFSLTQAPDKVRRFFRSASFGILRPVRQNIAGFEEQVAKWQVEMCGLFPALEPAEISTTEPKASAPERFLVDKDFVKAKLCGRWPDGHPVHPGAAFPPAEGPSPDEFDLKLYSDGKCGRFVMADKEGMGCPFGSHVRRMQPRPDAKGHLLRRPLLRRSVPFGSASFDRIPTDGQPRGHLAHFFCASIENQFEHLLGQWGARPPLGAAAHDDALDPLMGPHDDPNTGLRIPLQGQKTQTLTGFQAWTTTLGMAYAWYPGREGLRMLLDNDFVPVELAGPWL